MKKKKKDQIFAYIYDALLLAYGSIQNIFVLIWWKRKIIDLQIWNFWNHKIGHRDLYKKYVCCKMTCVVTHIIISAKKLQPVFEKMYLNLLNFLELSQITNKEFIAKLKVYVYRASNRVYINILFTLSSLPHDEKMKWQNGKNENSISRSRATSIKWLWYMYYTTISLFRYIISLADV